jgi:hypothetical protein
MGVLSGCRSKNCVGLTGKCTGIIGEYIGAIHSQVLTRPLVIEKERINFD